MPELSAAPTIGAPEVGRVNVWRGQDPIASAVGDPVDGISVRGGFLKDRRDDVDGMGTLREAHCDGLAIPTRFRVGVSPDQVVSDTTKERIRAHVAAAPSCFTAPQNGQDVYVTESLQRGALGVASEGNNPRNEKTPTQASSNLGKLAPGSQDCHRSGLNPLNEAAETTCDLEHGRRDNSRAVHGARMAITSS